MLNQNQLAYLKIIIAMFLWGGTYQAAKTLVAYLDPYTSSAVRWIIAAAVLTIFLVKKNSLRSFIQPKHHWPMILGIGFFSIAIYNILFFSAEQLLPANLVAIIISFTPCITVIFSAIFFRENINFLTCIGIAIAFLGAVFAINLSEPACSKLICMNMLHHLNGGELMAFLMCLGSALYSLLLKKSAQVGMDSLTITTLSSTAGAIALLVIALFKGHLSTLLALPLKAWSYILYLALFGSVLSYKWYSDGIKQLKVGQVVIFTNTIPLASIIIGILFFNNPVTYLFFFTALIVILGVVITNYSLIEH